MASCAGPPGIRRDPTPPREVVVDGVRLPAASPSQDPAPFRQSAPILSCPGNYDGVDVWIDAPESWGDVLFELVARNELVRSPVERVPASAVVRDPTSSQIRGLLLSARGHAVDEWIVRAYLPDTAPEGEATFVARASWGAEAPVDQLARRTTELYARPDQQQIFTTGGGGLASGDERVFAESPARVGTAITAIHVATETRTSGRLVIRRESPTATVELWSTAWTDEGASLSQQFPQPLYTPPDDRAEIRVEVTGATAPGDVELSVSGFYR